MLFDAGFGVMAGGNANGDGREDKTPFMLNLSLLQADPIYQDSHERTVLAVFRLLVAFAAFVYLCSIVIFRLLPASMSCHFIIKEWFGRLCNNLTQITHAYHLAEKTHSKLLLPAHAALNTAALVQLSDFSKGRLRDAMVEDNFFFTDHPLFEQFPIDQERRRSILRTILPVLIDNYLSRLSDRVPDHDVPDLVIHIRSGDVFQRITDPTLYATPNFVQPPLSFYRSIIRDGDFKSIQIVAEDDRNPCIGALLDQDKRISYRKQKPLEDISTLLAAKRLVIGYGTFAYVWALASYRLNTLYTQQIPAAVFGSVCNGDLKDVRICTYTIRNYIQNGDWSCSSEQLELMLNHSGGDVSRL